MDELISSLESFKISMQDEDKAIRLCEMILKQLESKEKVELVDTLIESGLVDYIIEFLDCNQSLSIKCKESLAELLAELAKDENTRLSFSEEELMIPLIEMLKEQNAKAIMQACRAIGNICYDNDIARKILVDNSGIQEIISLLSQLYNDCLLITNETECKDVCVKNTRLIAVITGCLVNAMNTYEDAVEIAIDEGIIDVLIKCLKKFGPLDEDVAVHCLLILHSLVDSDCGLMHLAEVNVLTKIIDLLDDDITDSTLEALVDIFTNLCEEESVKISMTKLNLPLKITKLINDSNHDQTVKKMLLDVITLILTEDTSMNLLYGNGEGEVYKECLNWMNSDDLNKIKAGVLAIGNFARNDSNCLNMVNSGVHVRLITMTKENLSADGDLRLQHACLSALRNLAIPVTNKKLLCEAGLVEILLKMSDLIQAYPVVFKLLGTVRMLIDKQETIAIQVGNDKTFLEHLIEWCSVIEHPGVNGEAVRLVASLVKNSKQIDVITSITESDALNYLIEMINSEHKVMQNEALIALALIISIVPIDLLERYLIERKFSVNLTTFLNEYTNKSANNETKYESLSNALTTIQMAISRSSILKDYLRTEKIDTILINIEANLDETNVDLKLKLNTIIKSLN